MPKALCWLGMVIALLILALFLVDLAAPATMAPFKKASLLLDILFVISAAALGYMSFTTLREQNKR